jgi:hypothetical protein
MMEVVLFWFDLSLGSGSEARVCGLVMIIAVLQAFS